MKTPCYHTIQADRHLAAIARGDQAFAATWQSLYDEFMAAARSGLDTVIQTPDYRDAQMSVSAAISEYLEFPDHDADRREWCAIVLDSFKGQDVRARSMAIVDRVATHHANYHVDRKMESQQ